jgi:succinyl-diaminopimelate desuccinylase
MLVVRLLAAGRNAHSAYPWLGDNALVKLQSSVASLLARYPAPAERSGAPRSPRPRPDPEPGTQPGSGDAEALLDIRFPAADTDLAGRTSAEVTAYLQGFCEPGVTPVVDILDPPHRADSISPRSAGSGTWPGARATPAACSASTASATAASTASLGIPAVAFGVGGSGQHGPDE